MRKICASSASFLVFVSIACIFVPSAFAQEEGTAQPRERDADFEQAIYVRLATIDPAAAVLFQDATLAMDEGDLETAKMHYEMVLELAPEFPDALRRLSYIESDLGNTYKAVNLARRAYTADSSPYNRIALAWALLETEELYRVSEALAHARAAAKELPDDADAFFVLLAAGMQLEEWGAIRQASTRLIELSPDNPLGHYSMGWVAAIDGDSERAEQELLLAGELGMPQEYVQEAISQVRDPANYFPAAEKESGESDGEIGLPALFAILIGGWLLVIFIVLAVGLLLGKLHR